MIDLKGRTVLVTGGSRGVGAAIVRAVCGAGATAILHYGSSDETARLVRDEVGGERCHLLRVDLADLDAAEKIWRGARDTAGRVDVLVNNAGIFEPVAVDAPVAEWRAAWDRVLRVNLLAPAELCRHAIVDFQRQGGGKIINIASRAAHRGESPDQMPYGASKGALVTLTKTIARGFASDGVLAFAISPGFTDTDMAASVDKAALRKFVAEIPLGEMAPPEEIGALTAFLCSDHARHLTGATFDINGASYVR